MNNFLNDIYNIIFGTEEAPGYIDDIIKSRKKIVLCGHSMGCVLAIQLALRIQQRNRIALENYLIVMGSASYRCLRPEEAASFHDLPNVFIFVCGGSLENKDTGKKN